MVQVKTYNIPPTALIPNSPYPLLHYPNLLLPTIHQDAQPLTTIHDLFRSHGWHTQWVIRYAPTQGSHYHSRSHECMVVLSGNATIRFGAADTSDDLQENTYGSDYEEGGLFVKANVGDVFVIPAGVAHKTFDPLPETPDPGLRMLASEDGHLSQDVGEARRVLEGVKLEGGFIMMGAYPLGCDWDWSAGGDHRGRFEEVWGVERPGKDPVLGESEEGVVGLWKEERASKLS